jgi:hypothetical protein
VFQNEQSVAQLTYKTGSIKNVSKVSINVDFGDGEIVEIDKKNVKDVYKVISILLDA